MVALPNRVYSAMAEQVTRVNAKAAAQADVDAWLRGVDPDRVIEALRSRNAELERQIDRLTAQLALRSEPSARLLHGRPVIGAPEAARQARVSLATCNRYLMSGRWEGEQDSSGRWSVYADQPLLPKERNQKGR